MSQQPFSRPGAVDLSGLSGAAPGAASAAGAPGGSSYSVQLDEQSFQATLEASMTAPVLLVFYSPSRMPESVELARDLETLATEFEGRFLAGLVDIDAVPQIAQATQIPSIPLVVAVIDGRPAPLFQDVLPIDQLRENLTHVLQQRRGVVPPGMKSLNATAHDDIFEHEAEEVEATFEKDTHSESPLRGHAHGSAGHSHGDHIQRKCSCGGSCAKCAGENAAPAPSHSVGERSPRSTS